MKPLVIAAVGDVQLGDSSACVGYGIASRYGPGDISGIFGAVRDHLSADVTIGNLEAVLSRRGVQDGVYSSLHMRGHPEYAQGLAAAGFTVLNVANNHAFQHGPEAFKETVETLRSHGIIVCGTRGDGRWSSQPAVTAVDSGVTIGCLGYSMRPRQFYSSEPPYAEGEPRRMVADVIRLARDVDYVLIAIHWGEEFVGDPARWQVELAHKLLDTGATLIAGHHPHVVGPTERVHDGVVAYSLGNFVTDMLWHQDLRTGLILKVRVDDGAIGVVTKVPTKVDNTYHLRVVPQESDQEELETVIGLRARDYRSAVTRSLRTHRWAKYRYALRNLHRFPPRILWQLLVRTITNKLFRFPARRR